MPNYVDIRFPVVGQPDRIRTVAARCPQAERPHEQGLCIEIRGMFRDI